MGQNDATNSWTIGRIELQRVPYFDTALAADSIDLEGVADSIDWAEPWLIDGQPGVGQAFWVIRSAGQTIVVDPCGASDEFLRSGPDAVTHQNAAFDLLRAAGCDPKLVDHVVLTHLDGIGMLALADGAAAGEEAWTPAFAKADVIVSTSEYDFILDEPADLMGARAFAALDAAGVVRAVETPQEIAPGITLRHTGAHSLGHCCIDIESDQQRAVMIGHLAISPLHAAAGVTLNHRDSQAAWSVLTDELSNAAATGALVAGSLWPDPGVAAVAGTAPFVLTPVAS
jgi:glyoxylase-like metal-dependent hydrolase (beta-lactamase superfamily II)